MALVRAYPEDFGTQIASCVNECPNNDAAVDFGVGDEGDEAAGIRPYLHNEILS